MLISTINTNKSMLTSAGLRVQYIKQSTIESPEKFNAVQRTNTEIQKVTKKNKILPVQNINVLYVASALYKERLSERSFKSIWA